MLVLFYFNWTGTPEESKSFASQMKTQVGEVEGAKLVGIFIPTSEWHYVVVWDVTKYEKVLEILNGYVKKYGALKMSLAKVELFHTPEEVPFM